MKRPVRELTRAQFLESYDWNYIFREFMNPTAIIRAPKYLSTEAFQISDVRKVIGLVEGEGDGPDWVGVFELADGRFATITAGCDYTGWDCQSGGVVRVASILKKAIRFGLSDEERRRLGMEQPV